MKNAIRREEDSSQKLSAIPSESATASLSCDQRFNLIMLHTSILMLLDRRFQYPLGSGTKLKPPTDKIQSQFLPSISSHPSSVSCVYTYVLSLSSVLTSVWLFPANTQYEFLTPSEQHVQSFLVFYIPGPISTSYPTRFTHVPRSIINYREHLFYPSLSCAHLK